FQLEKDQKNLLLKYTNNHLTYVALEVFLSTLLSLSVRARFFLLQDVSYDWLLRSCGVSISDICVLSTMVRLQMFNQIACVKQSTFLSAPRHRSSADLTLCLTPVVVI